MSVTTTRGKSDAIAASRCKGFRLALVVVAIVLISTVGCKRNPESPNFLRFIDAEPGPGYSKKIDGLLRRVLDPGANEQTFALGNGLPRSTLDFSMGVDDQGAGAAYDFEIFLDSGGTSQQLYRTRVEGVGWSQGRLDIDLSAAKDARVRFRKTLLSGPAPASTAAGWGNPVLLSHGAQVPPSIVLVSIDTLRGD